MFKKTNTNTTNNGKKNNGKKVYTKKKVYTNSKNTNTTNNGNNSKNTNKGKKVFNKGFKFIPGDKELAYFRVSDKYINRNNMELSESDLICARTIDLFAPLRDEGQITSIVGMQGCGKTTSIRNLIKFYYEYYNIKKIAVISINEREGEAKSWKDLDLHKLYCVSSKDIKYTPYQKARIVDAIFRDINKEHYDLVVVDSITGWYDLVNESGKEATMGYGSAGLRQDIFNEIWRTVANIKSKYVLCSVIQNTEVKVYGAINALFNSKADSTIYLEYELLRMNVFNNINPYKSYTRECNYLKERNQAINLLNNLGGSFRALIKMGAIGDTGYNKDFIYKM